jgi:beta-glucanase (GH16 family)
VRTATRLLVATVIVILTATAGVFALDTWNGRGAGSDSAEGAGSASTGGRLVVLPPVAQHGVQPARSAQASPVLTARFTPAREGGVVLLEQQVDDSWRVVTSAQQDASGAAVFADVAPKRLRSATFRATALAADGSPSTSTKPVAAGRWKSAFTDEFSGGALDGSKWDYRQLGSYNENGSRACSKSDERAVSVSGGTLQLQVQQDPERAYESCYTAEDGTLDYYLNGHVATENIFSFTHGVAAARIKFPRGRGQHGAFWMQPDPVEPVPGNPGKSGAEIDVVEYFGDDYPKGGLASFLYYLNKDSESEKVGGVWPQATRQLPPGDDWWRSYHVFSVEWTQNAYVFRVDGRETFRTREGVSGVPQFLILSLLSSDWELPHLDESTLPTTMDVDWVRVWQRKGSAAQDQAAGAQD